MVEPVPTRLLKPALALVRKRQAHVGGEIILEVVSGFEAVDASRASLGGGNLASIDAHAWSGAVKNRVLA